MGEVRKLQKKLRQIENLEIKISLTPGERFKVQKHLICIFSSRPVGSMCNMCDFCIILNRFPSGVTTGHDCSSDFITHLV